MNETTKRRATALDTINSFIVSKGKAPLTTMDLSFVINLARLSVLQSDEYAFVKAVNYVRKVTSVSVPVTWDTDIEQHGSNNGVNNLCEYIRTKDLHDTGSFKDGNGLGLKDADDIVQFVKANIGLLTD
jgi:hypothetical protein